MEGLRRGSMQKHRWLALMTMTALMTSGCATFLGSSEPEPTPESSPVPVAVAPAATPTSSPEAPLPAPAGGDLIPATNPQARILRLQPGVTTGRADPFETIAVNKPTEQPPAAPIAAPGPPTNGGERAVSRDVEPGESEPPPPPPEPTLARQVAVTGVIQLSDGLYAVVKAPQERTTRYVSVGQRLSNNQILVKRIDLYGPSPSVVLEEVGVEVTRAVGQAPEVPDKGEEA